MRFLSWHFFKRWTKEVSNTYPKYVGIQGFQKTNKRNLYSKKGLRKRLVLITLKANIIFSKSKDYVTAPLKSLVYI